MGIMIFDTSYLIEHPDAINRLTGNLVVPAIVLKQLDGLKNSKKEGVAHKARAASNAIIEAQRSGRLTISVDYNKVDMLDNNADNVILGTAAKLKETYTEVILLTTDTNMKIAAESMGVGGVEVEKEGIPRCLGIFASIVLFALSVVILAAQEVAIGFVFIILSLFTALYTIVGGPAFVNDNDPEGNDEVRKRFSENPYGIAISDRSLGIRKRR